jgi:uncharacterized protein
MYVLEAINKQNQSVLLNTVTQKYLPLDSSEATLRHNFFLAGQERDAVISTIDGWVVGDRLQLQVAPTWECNLRCTHCIVADRLKKRDNNVLDIVGLRDFASRFVAAYQTKKILLGFYGAEPLMDVAACQTVVDSIKSLGLPVECSLTTNLAMDLTPQHISLLSEMIGIGISLDGVEQNHNAQRIPVAGNINTFRTTLHNMKVLVLAGLKDKLFIKTCLRQNFQTTEDYKDFMRTIMQFGIPQKAISLGMMVPTKNLPEPTEVYLEVLRTSKLSTSSCCRYRTHVILVDNTNSIFSDFYGYTKLGTIYDSIDFLREQQTNLTIQTSPILNDPKCQNCQVIGYCWGGCYMHSVAKTFSVNCNQAGLIKHVTDAAASGALFQ